MFAAGQQGPTRTLTAALKRVKTVTGYIFYHTSKILQTRKLVVRYSVNLAPDLFGDCGFRALKDQKYGNA